MKHVVIVGAGFAGLHCALKLASRPEVTVTLLDKNNYQQFQPLLYQVASGLGYGMTHLRCWKTAGACALPSELKWNHAHTHMAAHFGAARPPL